MRIPQTQQGRVPLVNKPKDSLFFQPTNRTIASQGNVDSQRHFDQSKLLCLMICFVQLLVFLSCPTILKLFLKKHVIHKFNLVKFSEGISRNDENVRKKSSFRAHVTDSTLLLISKIIFSYVRQSRKN